jgi:hypothetical protein
VVVEEAETRVGAARVAATSTASSAALEATVAGATMVEGVAAATVVVVVELAGGREASEEVEVMATEERVVVTRAVCLAAA